MNFKDSLPLYPPEAYSEQNNPSAFMRQENSSPASNQQQNSTNPILPLLLKMLMGGQNASALSQNALEALSGSNESSPLLGILSSLASPQHKKNSSEPSSPKEKQFPLD